jgi:hypothetical protein
LAHEHGNGRALLRFLLDCARVGGVHHEYVGGNGRVVYADANADAFPQRGKTFQTA